MMLCGHSSIYSVLECLNNCRTIDKDFKMLNTNSMVHSQFSVVLSRTVPYHFFFSVGLVDLSYNWVSKNNCQCQFKTSNRHTFEFHHYYTAKGAQ